MQSRAVNKPFRSLAQCHKKIIDGICLFGAAVDRVHSFAKLPPTFELPCVPNDVLAGCAHTRFTVELVMIIEMINQQLAHFSQPWAAADANRLPSSARSRGKSTGGPALRDQSLLRLRPFR